MSSVEVDSVALQTLQISAISLACLSGLFGVYFVLFLLAIWGTYRHDTVSSRRLRWVTIALFMDLSMYFIIRSLQFARARLLINTEEEYLRWSTPLTVLGNVTSSVATILSDGTLVWRFYVVFGKERWALYLPAAAVVANTLLCWSAEGERLAVYSHQEFYEQTLLPVSLKIIVAWGWSTLLVNTLMSGGIIYKIAWANRSIRNLHEGGTRNSRRYATALHAVIESALVNWIGIVLYEVALLAPTGHITTKQNVGAVILEIAAIFFGISQVLITAHLGILRGARYMDTGYYSSQSDTTQRPISAPSFKVFTNVATVSDSQVEMDESIQSKTAGDLGC